MTEYAPEPASSSSATRHVLVLRIPNADKWRDGMVFMDEKGGFIAKVLKHEKVGHLASGDPRFRVTLGNEQNEVIAVVTRKIENMEDIYMIFSLEPNWVGQEPVPYMSKDSKTKTFDMYAVASLYQGTFGGDYTLKSSQNNKVLMKASNSNITWTLICCPCAIMCGGCKWELAFYKPHGGEPALVRDQGAQLLGVAAGENPLLGVCIAYAVDRQTTVAC